MGRAAATSWGGGSADLLLLAQVYETRAQFALQQVPGLGQAPMVHQGREAALADLGRAIEALVEVSPPICNYKNALSNSMNGAANWPAELGDSAGEWRDLCQLRGLLRSNIALGAGANLRSLIKVVSRRAQLLEAMDLQGSRLKKRGASACACSPNCSRKARETRGNTSPCRWSSSTSTWFHAARRQPHLGRRTSFDLITHLCEAVELVFSTPPEEDGSSEAPWSWIPTRSPARGPGVGRAPLSTARLSHCLLRVFAQREGSQAWGELLPLVLKDSSWDDLPHSLSAAFFAHWAAWAGEVSARWMGDAFRTLVDLPLRRLRESPDATKALRYCLESWCALPSHQLALMGVPHERLAALAGELIVSDPAPSLWE